jgi:hypothetical protein
MKLFMHAEESEGMGMASKDDGAVLPAACTYFLALATTNFISLARKEFEHQRRLERQWHSCIGLHSVSRCFIGCIGRAFDAHTSHHCRNQLLHVGAAICLHSSMT